MNTMTRHCERCCRVMVWHFEQGRHWWECVVCDVWVGAAPTAPSDRERR